MAGGPILGGTQVPSTAASGGVFYNTTGLLEGHIFNQGLEQPDVLRSLIIKFPEFYLTSLFDKLGASGDVENSTRSWAIQDRTRKGATVSSVANGTSATATLTLDTVYDTSIATLGYWLVGDTFRVANTGAIGRVTAVGNSGGFQTIDVVRVVGGNWSTSLINTAHKIGHIGSSYGEGSTGAGGYRNYFPDMDWNITTILRRDFKIDRDAMTSKKWLDGTKPGQDWWYTIEDIEQKEIMRDLEATALFGTRFRATSLQGANMSRGIMEYAETSGVQQTFSSAIGVQEADLANFVKNHRDQQGGNDLVLLCGSQFLHDAQFALKEYRSIPNSATFAEKAGLNFTSYEILGKRLHFTGYELFSDTAIVPSVTASSTAKDFSNLALVLDFSQTEHGKNLQLHYRKNAKMIQKLIPGMVSPGPTAASKFDGFEGALLTEFMPVCFLPNRLGLIYANS